MGRHMVIGIVSVLAAIVIINCVYQSFRAMPAGLDYRGPFRAVNDVQFLVDQTFIDNAGMRHSEQTIFDEVFRLISQAEKLVYLDWFLFNDFAGASNTGYRPITQELTEALIQRKAQVPQLRIVFITDHFNTLYGGVDNPYLERLTESGVEVVYTDLTQLRDSNPVWSGIWRALFQWFGNTVGGILPSPVNTAPVSLRTYLAILNWPAVQ